MARQTKYYNALASMAGVFRAYFIHTEGHWTLFEVDKEHCDKAETMHLREWVRKSWPRKISKLLGNQSVERTFRCQEDAEDVEPMSDLSNDIKPKRRRLQREIRMLTETPEVK